MKGVFGSLRAYQQSLPECQAVAAAVQPDRGFGIEVMAVSKAKSEGG